MKRLFAAGLGILSLAPIAGGARAEVSDVRMATQFGIGVIPMIVIQQNKLLERQLEKAGLPGTKVSWRQFPGGNPINEGLISGNLDIASAGTTVFVTLWAKAMGTASAVRGIGAVSALPLWFLTRNPRVNALEDLSDGDKIAVTTQKVGVHAMLLQMAAEKRWGPTDSTRYDRLATTIPHADAAAALISGGTEINNHFSAPPFQYAEAKAPSVRRVTTAQEILGGRATYMVAYTTERFRNENPKTYAAFVAALKEAFELIARDPRKAAADYLAGSKEAISLDDTVAMITDPEARFTLEPAKVLDFARFMQKQGITRTVPDTWQAMFFPEVHGLPGS